MKGVGDDAVKIVIRNFWRNFPDIPLSDEQVSVYVKQWSACQSTVDIFKALDSCRKKQKGKVANRLKVNDADLAGAILRYADAILRNTGKLPVKQLPKEPIPTPPGDPRFAGLDEVIAGGGFDETTPKKPAASVKSRSRVGQYFLTYYAWVQDTSLWAGRVVSQEDGQYWVDWEMTAKQTWVPIYETINWRFYETREQMLTAYRELDAQWEVTSRAEVTGHREQQKKIAHG